MANANNVPAFHDMTVDAFLAYSVLNKGEWSERKREIDAQDR